MDYDKTIGQGRELKAMYALFARFARYRHEGLALLVCQLLVFQRELQIVVLSLRFQHEGLIGCLLSGFALGVILLKIGESLFEVALAFR